MNAFKKLINFYFHFENSIFDKLIVFFMQFATIWKKKPFNFECTVWKIQLHYVTRFCLKTVKNPNFKPL